MRRTAYIFPWWLPEKSVLKPFLRNSLTLVWQSENASLSKNRCWIGHWKHFDTIGDFWTDSKFSHCVISPSQIRGTKNSVWLGLGWHYHNGIGVWFVFLPSLFYDLDICSGSNLDQLDFELSFLLYRNVFPMLLSGHYTFEIFLSQIRNWLVWTKRHFNPKVVIISKVLLDLLQHNFGRFWTFSKWRHFIFNAWRNWRCWTSSAKWSWSAFDFSLPWNFFFLHPKTSQFNEHG